jgi:hypothetical protein
VTVIFDNVMLQRPGEQLVQASPALVALAEGISLNAVPEKCGVHSPNLDAAADVAAGSPIGSNDFVKAFAKGRATKVCSAIDKLAQLPLPKQDKFLLLKGPLQLRMSHLSRVAEWDDAGKAAVFTIGCSFQLPNGGKHVNTSSCIALHNWYV